LYDNVRALEQDLQVIHDSEDAEKPDVA